MYINNIEELVETLKPKLRDYLVSKIGQEATKKTFKCYVHEDSSPSMAFNPKTGDTTVHCFGCGVTHDIFSAANYFENLPATGADWVTQTLPHLANLFNFQLKLGEISPVDKEKHKLHKLFSDITNIFEATSPNQITIDYLKKRSWSNEKLIINSIAQKTLVANLAAIGWETTQLYSLLSLSSTDPLFGEDRITFVIKDYRGRPVGFTTRNLSETGAKYVNSRESLIYEKRKILFGLDVALKDAKKQGLYIVEGAGDVAAAHRVGIYNIAATCGTAFTADHLALIKMLGIRQIFLCLDWDDAGQKAMRRILKDELKFTTGVSCTVVEAPNNGTTDVSQFLEQETSSKTFLALNKVPAFEWVLRQATNSSPEELCQEMIPIIASEQTAVRREFLISVLSNTTQISTESIKEDIQEIRDSKVKDRYNRLQAAAEKYKREIENDPGNAQALLSQHQEDLVFIEKEFNKQSLGVDYQLNRYDALQESRLGDEATIDRTEFKLGWFTIFAAVFSGGMSWTEGVLIYVPGRANSGKTATVIAIATDIALHDPDAIVIMHFTDDTYAQVEPRIKTNIGFMIGTSKPLTIGMTANPKRNILTNEDWANYNKADSVFRELIASEKLTIIDSEDGSTLSTLEKNIKRIRSKFPDKKLFVMCDNTHNYMDFLNLDQTSRITRISNVQKDLTGRYRCCMMATAEYKKNQSQDATKIRLPVDEDMADARALMYRPNAIIHVYNDVHDRPEHSTIYWTKPDAPNDKLPRLCLCVSKNKITKFKDKLIFDLDNETVALKQEDATKARRESLIAERKNAGEEEEDEFNDSIEVETDYY